MSAFDLAVPLVVAAVFTLGGRAILRTRRRADEVGAWLFAVFLMMSIIASGMLFERLAGRAPVRLAQTLDEARVAHAREALH